MVVGLLDYIVSSSPIPFPLDFGLWILDFGLGFCTLILDLDFGLDLGLTIVSHPASFYFCGVGHGFEALLNCFM